MTLLGQSTTGEGNLGNSGCVSTGERDIIGLSVSEAGVRVRPSLKYRVIDKAYAGIGG